MAAPFVRGRASVVVQERADLRDEVKALRAEQVETGAEIVRLSQYLWRSAAINGDPDAVSAAKRVIYLAGREMRRGGGGDRGMSLEWPRSDNGCLICQQPARRCTVHFTEIGDRTWFLCEAHADKFRVLGGYEVTAEVKRESEAGTQSDSLFPVAGP